ncbi:hypothetical protein RB195_003582 [Necator americanus]|uniref:SXP/RAL-2 family protein Ani s 5-like cation-binding domain-containing protein n=1 Tax=Necator americanus TaxID=51031 RepID=A0ABR1DP97_NECAM
MRTIAALLLVTFYVYAQQPQFALPRLPKELPPGFAEVLPQDVIMRLRAVHEDPNLTAEQQHEQIDQIMSSLPEELIEKLPQPPGFENLPQSTRQQLKAIHHDKTINWRQRHEKIRAVLEAVPPHLRPQMPPPPPLRGARAFRAPNFVI